MITTDEREALQQAALEIESDIFAKIDRDLCTLAGTTFGVPPERVNRTAVPHHRTWPLPRRVLGFDVVQIGGFAWIDTMSHDAISHEAPCRGNLAVCGVLVYAQDVERACLDLLRAGARPWPAAPGGAP